MSAPSESSTRSCTGGETLSSGESARPGFTSLITLAGDGKYSQVDALRALMRGDSRFEWVGLPGTDAVPQAEVLARRKGVAASVQPHSDDKLRALLEADSIPQYVWPAATPLQQWINAHRDVFAGRTVLELGCGTGVVGFTVAHYARLVVLTDYSAVSLAMTLESLRHNNFTNCRVAALSWGRDDQMAHIKEACGVEAFDIVIGSDVFYFSGALRSGLATARRALEPASSRDAVFLCGSVARSDRMEADLDEMPLQEGFTLSSFVADGPFYLYSWQLASA